MPVEFLPRAEECTCLSVRQAARHITQFYDQHLATSGLRATQFSILAKIARLGPLTINALAEELVMDRTTLGRNILPLEREGLIRVEPGRSDRRSKELVLTEPGRQRLRLATEGWRRAQSEFAARFGDARTQDLRAILNKVWATELPPVPSSSR